MTASTTDRNTPKREGVGYVYPVKGSTKIYAGTIVCLDANGLAVPGSDTANLKTAGVAQEYVDNSAGADGAKTVKVHRGVFQFDSASLADADIGKIVYVSDDQTVVKTVTTNKVVAGRLMAIEGAAYAWVDFTVRSASGVADIATADAATQSGAYVQADVETISVLANASKAKINAVLAALRAAGIIGA